jgi:hypothetical protein
MRKVFLVLGVMVGMFLMVGEASAFGRKRCSSCSGSSCNTGNVFHRAAPANSTTSCGPCSNSCGPQVAVANTLPPTVGLTTQTATLWINTNGTLTPAPASYYEKLGLPKP